MKTRVAINGFGRIGRNAFKIAFARSDIEIVAINDLTDTKTLAYLLKHDSNYGTYDAEVGHDEKGIIVNGKHIKVTAEKDPSVLPWGEDHIDIVIESTGRFTDKEGAEGHIKAGAKSVVISGPTKSDGVDTIVLGANEDKLEDATVVISNASCTTNSLGAVMAILDGEFGVQKSMMTTVHSYTASQVLQDAPAKDLREGRNAAENIVPTTTGAATAVALALPQFKGKFDGVSIRVPTPVLASKLDSASASNFSNRRARPLVVVVVLTLSCGVPPEASFCAATLISPAPGNTAQETLYVSVSPSRSASVVSARAGRTATASASMASRGARKCDGRKFMRQT